MVWRSRKRYSSYRSRGYSRVRSVYKSGGGSILFAAGGAAAGYFAPRVVPYQDMIMTAIAVLPGVLPVGKVVPWQLRRFASGYVAGAMARAFVPNVLGVTASSGGIDYV